MTELSERIAGRLGGRERGGSWCALGRLLALGRLDLVGLVGIAATKLTVRLEHEPGEALQLDWLELSDQRRRGVARHTCWSFSEGESFPYLAQTPDGVLRRPGGTARSCRLPRLA